MRGLLRGEVLPRQQQVPGAVAPDERGPANVLPVARHHGARDVREILEVGVLVGQYDVAEQRHLGVDVARADISLYERTKHSFATDAIRRGVPERHLQTFLGHPSIESTRRYARLADNALLEVLRPSKKRASDKAPRDEAQQIRRLRRGPSWIRTRDLTGYEPAALDR